MSYRFSYDEESPYARAVELVRRHRLGAGRVVVDLGCGHGAIAEPLAELGLTYVGLDSDAEAISALAGRGFEAEVVDLAEPDGVAEVLARILGDRALAAVCMLDTLEHLAAPEAVLRSLRRFCAARGGAPLVVSIPNVTHLDLGVKLLMGRWDVTPTGLLDATHLRFFSESLLEQTMARSGWEHLEAADFELVVSDQHFPPDAVPLDRATPLGALLTSLRSHSGPAALVNQFVRAYAPTGTPAEGTTSTAAADDGAPFLSVLVRTQGERLGTLGETLLSLAAQTCPDFEVLVLAHDTGPGALGEIGRLVEEFDPSFGDRVRVVPVEGGGRARPLNVGARLARGHHLAALDDDDLALGHWVETMRDASAHAPGAVVHVGVAVQPITADGTDPGYRVTGRPRCPYPLAFEQLDHVTDNRTPNCGLAVPRSLVADMGEGWDESLPVYEDWEYLLRASALCGVQSAPSVAALVRVWETGGRSTTVHTGAEWDDARMALVARVDARPLLLGPGAMSRLRRLVAAAESGGGPAWRGGVGEAEHHETKRALEAAQADLEALRSSTSWRATALPRALASRARRLLGRRGRS